MSRPVIKRYMKDGTVRAIWSDDTAARERSVGGKPVRASRIEVIMCGKNEGKFYVDFSLLAEFTGDNRFAVCLVELFDKYADAVAAEIAWLTENYVKGE